MCALFEKNSQIFYILCFFFAFFVRFGLRLRSFINNKLFREDIFMFHFISNSRYFGPLTTTTRKIEGSNQSERYNLGGNKECDRLIYTLLFPRVFFSFYLFANGNMKCGIDWVPFEFESKNSRVASCAMCAMYSVHCTVNDQYNSFQH